MSEFILVHFNCAHSLYIIMAVMTCQKHDFFPWLVNAGHFHGVMTFVLLVLGFAKKKLWGAGGFGDWPPDHKIYG